MLDNVVSSAHMIMPDMLMAFEKSFVHIINKRGSIIELGGTPIVINKVSDFISSISIYCFFLC